jgi:subtilisin family serine protease
VAAAGNDGLDDDGDVASPGSVELAISVGATTREGAVWANSSSGSLTDKNGESRAHPHMKPEVVAPGERIVSTGEDNLWYSSSGSSDATVFVTGALALILEDQPRLKPQSGGDSSCLVEVKRALLESLGEGDGVHDLRRGYGLLSASAWLEEARDIPSC